MLTPLVASHIFSDSTSSSGKSQVRSCPSWLLDLQLGSAWCNLGKGIPVAQHGSGLRCPVEAMADVRVTPRFVHGLHLVHVNLYDLYAGQASSRFIKHLRNHLCFVDCSSAACSSILQRIRECHAPAFCPSTPCLVSKSTVALLFELVNVCQLQLELCLPRHQVGPNGRNAQAADRRGSPQPNEKWHWAKKDILYTYYIYWGFFLIFLLVSTIVNTMPGAKLGCT